MTLETKPSIRTINGSLLEVKEIGEIVSDGNNRMLKFNGSSTENVKLYELTIENGATHKVYFPSNTPLDIAIGSNVDFKYSKTNQQFSPLNIVCSREFYFGTKNTNYVSGILDKKSRFK